ncbi:helix-turn-helix domain-containing protein [Pseudosporangium ferrugineum]|uniref:Helix-turn-helix protein n=1 Tax=Pseudosporangium ferrugineum TaxID=439699 RepID=A0A2T0RJS4_9ACTN|nr:helix-turn-helix transcriptional regulator [Pseudosporangium ferrugineum]PRY21362.1 helix-turn-helix protein [Pseudosporangium ferrugineum]
MVDTTRELAAFLRSRRERLDPIDAGLPVRRRSRRTPGLRREEVAELAGVSVDYVVRLEQARGLRPSADVAEALSRALRLSADERAYLFDLAGQRLPAAGKPAATATPALARLIGDLSPRPAMVVNYRYDILAWNGGMARVYPDLETMPPARRNAMWLCLGPERRGFYAEPERIVREAVAHLRTTWAAHPEDPALAGLIGQLLDGDEEFARLWAQRDVRVNGRGRKVIRHPEAGEITVRFEILAALEDPGQLLVIGSGVDDRSRAALERLTAGVRG